MKARRNDPRVRRRYKVRLGGLVAFTTNISATGLCAEFRGQVLPKGAPIDGTLQIGARALCFTGHVAWSKHGDWHLNVHGKMGIHFIQAPPELDILLAVGGQSKHPSAGTVGGG